MTGPFDTFLMVDWSGGNDTGPRPRKDAIWAALATRQGPAGQPVYLRNRQEAASWLARTIEDELAAGRRLLAGFDFPFGYPEGFAASLTGMPDPLAVWDWYAEHLRDRPASNNRFELAGRINGIFSGIGPFWFNALRRDVPGLPRKGNDRTPDHGLPERRRVELRARGSFTCWQMGGAGAVGSQAMTGMAVLSRLRRAFPSQIAVWPFEPLETPVAFVEIWPSLLDAEVRTAMRTGEIRDAAQVRVLAEGLSALQRAGGLDDVLAAVEPDARSEEGWILGVGAEAALRRALR